VPNSISSGEHRKGEEDAGAAWSRGCLGRSDKISNFAVFESLTYIPRLISDIFIPLRGSDVIVAKRPQAAGLPPDEFGMRIIRKVKARDKL
jgi:hypothetical protein